MLIHEIQSSLPGKSSRACTTSYPPKSKPFRKVTSMVKLRPILLRCIVLAVAPNPAPCARYWHVLQNMFCRILSLFGPRTDCRAHIFPAKWPCSREKGLFGRWQMWFRLSEEAAVAKDKRWLEIPVIVSSHSRMEGAGQKWTQNSESRQLFRELCFSTSLKASPPEGWGIVTTYNCVSRNSQLSEQESRGMRNCRTWGLKAFEKLDAFVLS